MALEIEVGALGDPLELAPPEPRSLLGPSSEETTAEVGARVAVARDRARQRGVRCNAMLRADRLDTIAPLEPEARDLLEAALLDGRLTARGFRRVWRLARTIADLDDGPERIAASHASSALLLRIRPAALLGTAR